MDIRCLGGLHGIYLIVNHVWHSFRLARTKTRDIGIVGFWAARLLTFVAVVVGWVFFRSETFAGATAILEGMAGLNGISLPTSYKDLLGPLGEVLFSWGWRFDMHPGLFHGSTQILWIMVLLWAVWTLPNTQEIMARYRPAYETVTPSRVGFFYQILTWRPTLGYAAALALILALSLLSLRQVSEFLYFQF